MTSYVGIVEQARGLAERERILGRGGEAYDQLADYIEQLQAHADTEDEAIRIARGEERARIGLELGIVLAGLEDLVGEFAADEIRRKVERVVK
jgi:hypothetical protein